MLTGQTALVTGASRGIGRAIALRLAREGAQVFLHYHRNRSAAESVLAEIERPGGLLQADLRLPGEIDKMIATLGAAQLDILVNNAGIWGQTPLGNTSLQDLEAMLDINVKGVFYLTQTCLPRLREGARIMTICNACRYCEGYCPTFRAIEMKREFEQKDVLYLANLCHDCRACYYACMYSPPHEFAINLPQVLSTIRQESYQDWSWPALFGRSFTDKRIGAALAAGAACPSPRGEGKEK